jgi:hypothetical protein
MLAAFLCALNCSGCQVGRSWFHMDSNSGTPFFGFDLLPHRTTQLTEPETKDPAESTLGGTAKTTVRPATDKAATSTTLTKELHLPRVPKFLGGETEEELSFTGPDAAFVR